MSVRIVALLHPFSTQRIYATREPASLSELYASLDGAVLDVSYATFQINDEPVADLSTVPADGDTVVIRVSPSGGRSNQDKGIAGVLLGAVMFVAGAAMVLTGFGAAFGISLMGVGVSTMLGGGVLYNLDIPDPAWPADPGRVASAPSIRGSRNRTNTSGSIPLILGRHFIAPDNGALPFTSIDSAEDQYLHQLFVVGPNDLNVETATFKIGDTPLSYYQGVTHAVIQNGSFPSWFNEVVRETSIGRQIKKLDPDGNPGDVVVTTASNCYKVGVDIVFSQGLLRFNDQGHRVAVSVSIAAEYRTAGTGGWNHLGYFQGGSYRITGSEARTRRFQITATMPSAGQWDIRLRRLTADSTETRVMDDVAWASLKSYSHMPPVAPSVASKLTLVALKVRASDQLQGVIDQFNLIAQTRIPDYNGWGTGTGAWPVRNTTNPASLYLYVLRGTSVTNRPLADNRIDWAAFEAWHQFCASHSYQCNAVIVGGKTRNELLQAIAQTGRALPAKRDGKHTIILDVERPAPIQHFSPRNSRSFVGRKTFAATPHALRAQFINAAYGFQPDERVVYAPGYSASGGGGTTPATRIQTVDMWGVTSADQVYRTVQYMIAVTALRPEIWTIDVDFEHLVCTRGDLVTFAYDVPLIGLSSGRIKHMDVHTSGHVQSIVSDERFVMEAGKTYAMWVRKADGTFLSRTVVAAAGEFDYVALIDWIPPSDAPSVGDLFSFGESNRVKHEAIVLAIDPGNDLSAKLTLTDYAPAIFGVDDPGFIVPPYVPNITIPGDFNRPPVVTDIFDPGAEIKRLAEQQAASGAVNVTKAELAAGINAPELGLTATPDIPQLRASAGFRTIVLRINRQIGLAGAFRGYHLQIANTFAPDTGTYNWSAPPEDGQMVGSAGWRDTGNPLGYLLTTEESYTFVAAKLLDALDAPVAQTYFWRARRASYDAVSDWCTAVQATVTPLSSDDIEVGSIKADRLDAKIIAGILARFNELTIEEGGADDALININEQLGYETETKSLLRRAFVRPDLIALQERQNPLHPWDDVFRVEGGCARLSGGMVDGVNSTVVMDVSNGLYGAIRGWDKSDSSWAHVLHFFSKARSGFDAGTANLYGAGGVSLGPWNSPTLFATASGRIGIGTTNPGAKCHISDGDLSLLLLGPNTQWHGFLVVGAGPHTHLGLERACVFSSDGTLRLDAGSASSTVARATFINHHHNGNVLMCSGTNQGNVGIGTGSPACKLDVAGMARFQGGRQVAGIWRVFGSTTEAQWFSAFTSLVPNVGVRFALYGHAFITSNTGLRTPSTIHFIERLSSTRLQLGFEGAENDARRNVNSGVSTIVSSSHYITW